MVSPTGISGHMLLKLFAWLSVSSKKSVKVLIGLSLEFASTNKIRFKKSLAKVYWLLQSSIYSGCESCGCSCASESSNKKES